MTCSARNSALATQTQQQGELPISPTPQAPTNCPLGRPSITIRVMVRVTVRVRVRLRGLGLGVHGPSREPPPDKVPSPQSVPAAHLLGFKKLDTESVKVTVGQRCHVSGYFAHSSADWHFGLGGTNIGFSSSFSSLVFPFVFNFFASVLINFFPVAIIVFPPCVLSLIVLSLDFCVFLLVPHSSPPCHPFLSSCFPLSFTLPFPL